jgi:hypothetical protein
MRNRRAAVVLSVIIGEPVTTQLVLDIIRSTETGVFEIIDKRCLGVGPCDEKDRNNGKNYG